MPRIQNVRAREILDSRGNPTIETKITLEDGTEGVSSVASGASTGTHEALELRDGDPNRYNGLGVLKAVANVNEIIAKKVIGKEPSDQEGIDNMLQKMDGTLNKSHLGANAILSVSLAICRVSSNSLKAPLYRYLRNMYDPNEQQYRIPSPMFNILNGGKHGVGNLEFQEFMIILNQLRPYHQSLQIGGEIYKALKDVLVYHNVVNGVGDEGGFAPNLFTNLDALELMMEAIKATPYKFGADIFLGLDVAANHFYREEKYTIKDRAIPLSAQQMIEYFQDLNSQYHLLTIEDPLFEDDWEGWVQMTQAMQPHTIVVADDLLATNAERLKKAVEMKAANAILVKPNQIGTLSETMRVIRIAREAGWRVVVSHRSGETNDTFIADLGVGVNAEYVKFGAPARGERVAKYNRLLEIEQEIGFGHT
ncbi:MAG TPA: phosphopyruvate hydratase [Patescibacteria group bacterium]|nr:phosphopyruvate hydratase [Patescibacteria group bacterium]